MSLHSWSKAQHGQDGESHDSDNQETEVRTGVVGAGMVRPSTVTLRYLFGSFSGGKKSITVLPATFQRLKIWIRMVS